MRNIIFCKKWTVFDNGTIHALDDEDYPLVTIAIVKSFKSEIGQWNARLIAAAPEMYQLLHDELTGEAGGTLSSAHEEKVRKLLTKIDGDD